MQGESFKTRFFRYGINLYPMFFGTGGKVLFISADWHKVIVRLKLGLWTRNYVGTIFGGSMFAAADPFHMVMLVNILGKEYVVWDKAGAIQFKKPGRGKIKTEFIFTEGDLAKIKSETQTNGKYEFVREVQWIDEQGDVVSIVEKTLYVATKEYYRTKQAEKKAAKATQ